MIAGNGQYSIIVAVSRQHGRTKREKVRMRQAVVFQDDPFLDVLEKPTDGFADSMTTAAILAAEERGDFAGPIDRSRDPTGFGAQRRFTVPLRSRPIGCDKETGWSGSADRCKYLCGNCRPVEDQKKDGSVKARQHDVRVASQEFA